MAFKSRTRSLDAPRSILFYKPYNVLSQFTNPDQLDCQTLKDFVDVPGLYSVGRLDRDSEGLLLLTNDGRLKHRLSHPQFRHPRTYWVQVEHVPQESALEQLRQGVTIKGGYLTAPARVQRLSEQFEAETQELWPRTPPIRFRKTVPTAWLALTLTEGKNRQVRRMTAAVNHPTLRLVRSRIGLFTQASLAQKETREVHIVRQSSEQFWLTLQGLSPGQWRELTDTESLMLAQLSGQFVVKTGSRRLTGRRSRTKPSNDSRSASQNSTSRYSARRKKF